MSTEMQTKQDLEDFLANGKDWEKMETPIAGVFIVRIPATKKAPAKLSLEINPIDEFKKPIRRKGLFIGNEKLRREFVVLLENADVINLMSLIGTINPTPYEKRRLNFKLQSPQAINEL